MSRRSRLLALDGLIGLAWLSSIGSVVWHEHGGMWGSGSNPLARLSAGLAVKEQWFGIYHGDHKIGFAHTMLAPDEREGVPGVSLTDSGRVRFTLLGLPQDVELSAHAFIDADWRLQRFSASLTSAAYRLRWSGYREGDELVVRVQTDASETTTRLKAPERALVVGLSPWLSFHQLKEGQWGNLWILNPLALTPEEIYFHVRGRDQLDGQEVLVIETDVRGVRTTSWVTPEGDVVKEESALGWRLLREPQQQALQALTSAGSSFDLLSAAAIPLDRPLGDPQRIRRLVCLITGLAPDAQVERAWQRQLPPEVLSRYPRAVPQQPWSLIELRRPAAPVDRPPVPPSVERYRRPSLFVQSDDPAIRRRAQTVVGEATDVWRQAEALQVWVHRTLTKRLTVGLPSALDVLASLSGDCHEHTVLFTALARSLGIPTRMLAGLAAFDGRLYYHAWPEVWVGEWIPVDPTLGQPVADALHLGLVEAENEQLLSLGQFVGALRIEVLEVEED